MNTRMLHYFFRHSGTYYFAPTDSIPSLSSPKRNYRNTAAVPAPKVNQFITTLNPYPVSYVAS